MKSVIYARVSTHDQSAEMQLRELRDLSERRGWQLAGEYIDPGISGAQERRPQLDKLMADAKRRRFDVVLVYRYDRFARSLRQLVNALAEFHELGIDFVSLHEGVDTSTSTGRLMFGIFASFAEFEREVLRERIRSGLSNAKARGQKLGRPRMNVDVKAVRARLKSGESLRAIAKSLEVSPALLWKRTKSN
jgi:DNA invertase Pin-like site-specific DNA recombinase